MVYAFQALFCLTVSIITGAIGSLIANRVDHYLQRRRLRIDSVHRRTGKKSRHHPR